MLRAPFLYLFRPYKTFVFCRRNNVKLDFDLPQEDELATNVMSGGVSPYSKLDPLDSAKYVVKRL